MRQDPIAAAAPNSRPLTPSAATSPPPGYAYRVTITVLVVILIGGAAYLLWRSVHTLLLAFAGILFGLFLSALAEWLRRWTGIRYGWALAVVVAVLVLLTAGTGWLLANSLAAQLAALSQTLPEALDRLRESLAQYSWGRLLVEQGPRAADSTVALAGDPSRVTGAVSGVWNFLVAVVVILFVGVFVAAETGLYRAGLLHLVPTPQRRRAAQTLDALGYNLRWWLVGQATLMVTMGATTAVGLWLIGIPMPLALGLIAGLFELVSYVGPWLSAIPAALVALLVSPSHLMLVLGLYLVLHILEGYVLVPLIQRRAVRLPPALTIVAQFLFAELFGILGLFVAAPLMVVVVVSLKMLYV